jgi:deoxyribodipyrimidine photo-lyase
MGNSALHWFRRDLRVADNKALAAAIAGSERVYCVFVFDTEILDPLTRRADRRVEFILRSVEQLAAALVGQGGSLIVLHGQASQEIPRLARELQVDCVFANRDYEPAAMVRDATIAAALSDDGIAFIRMKDQVVFEQDELLSGEGRPYTVFSAYRNAWLKRLPETDLEPAPSADGRGRLAAVPPKFPIDRGMPSLGSLGFEATNLLEVGVEPGAAGAERALQSFLPRMAAYRQARDHPAEDGVSYLSVHLRFGTIAVRRLVNEALRAGSDGARAWLGELIWRDFYFSILYLFPHVVGHAFRREFEHLAFSNRDDYFEAWCAGRTGYPLVDAGMRQLNQTGYMHNRLRMVTASFLVKDLQVDWRRGERYFAERLNDYDLAANNGGWQWSASTGNDAQPWFRIFNPVLQSKRFDADGRFIRRYVPELADCEAKWIHEPWKAGNRHTAGLSASAAGGGGSYPPPIVDHLAARQETLRIFEAATRGGRDPAGKDSR